MRLEWNLQKASENLRKHGVDFADAVIALEDVNALTIEDKDHDEQRFRTLGMVPNFNILYVIYTYREKDCLRIISARKADRSEQKQYNQGVSYE